MVLLEEPRAAGVRIKGDQAFRDEAFRAGGNPHRPSVLNIVRDRYGM